MRIASLIGIMMAFVVGINLIPVFVGSEEVVEEVANGSSLIDILPLIIVVLILIGAVAWVGGIVGGGEGLPFGRWISSWTTRRPNPKSLGQYFSYRSWPLREDKNNLDRLVGVKIEPIEGTEEEPLQLRGTTLALSKEFCWYLDEKHSKHTMYKMVGLHGRHRNFNCIYILGIDSHTRQPYLLRLPPGYLQRPLEDCLRWCLQAGMGDIIKEV